MAVYAVGDSIAVGLGTTSLVTNSTSGPSNETNDMARGSLAIPAMRSYFERAIGATQRGDTVIVSAGYNYGNQPIPEGDLTQLKQWIERLETKGANVVILGMREEWPSDGVNTDYYRGIYADAQGQMTTIMRNNQLRTLARNSGVEFSESSIAVANRIFNGHPDYSGEIHGGYRELAEAAQRDVRPRAAASAPAAETSGAAPAPDAAVDAPAAGTPRASDVEAAAAAAQGNEPSLMESIFATLVEFPIIGGLFRMLAGAFGIEVPPETDEDASPAAAPADGQTRTLTQEITDVTTALGVAGQSAALQDNTLSDDEKNSLKTEIEQVRGALPATMDDATRQSITSLLGTLQQAGVQDTDSTLGTTLTQLRNDIGTGTDVAATDVPRLPAPNGERVRA